MHSHEMLILKGILNYAAILMKSKGSYLQWSIQIVLQSKIGARRNQTESMAEPGLLHAPFQMFQELICDPSLIFFHGY